LRRYCRGDVLDVGGWDFYRSVRRRHISVNSWTILEIESEKFPEEVEVNLVIGDGCNMGLSAGQFNTVLCVQVLEHVFDPISMVNEMCRVLKERGHLILLVPQTSTLHMAPRHFYNFTRFWIQEALTRNKMEVIEVTPLGGIWSSMASHLFFFPFQSVRYRGMSTKECKRNLLFYLLYPFMLLFAAAAIPVCLIFSLGDLTEEPNNHLIVARKPAIEASERGDLTSRYY
jgi:SAM-dependent methyltransferase